MKKIFGNTGGLKAKQLQSLQNFYRRRVRPDDVVSPELARAAAGLSRETRRQVGFLIDRSGEVTHVMVGDAKSIAIPELPKGRTSSGRLKGLRMVHTHLDAEALGGDDLLNLALLRLDLVAAINAGEDGLPQSFHVAHLLPEGPGNEPYRVLPPLSSGNLDLGLRELISGLETEFARAGRAMDAGDGQALALLVSVTTENRAAAEDSMAELSELARSSGIHVAGTLIQHRKSIDPRYLLGKGKLQDLMILALQKGADLVIFDFELNPSQIASITEKIEIPVIDRTQLILDIFAQRAMSREGKLQVELAQMRYLLPRLAGRNDALSRLAGGIGGRGPGETKLEIDRRRARERIRHLEKELKKVQKERQTQRSRRGRNNLPVISIVGYTNAGKSTLLNTLTKSRVLAESRLFATLDPSSRRLRFPRDREVIITDTVGFIRDLPKELVSAFRATLEELESADLLLHVIDASNPRVEQQIQSVETILSELGLDRIPSLRVCNKMDLVPKEARGLLCDRLGGVPVSANDSGTLGELLERIQRMALSGGPGQEEENAGLAHHAVH